MDTNIVHRLHRLHRFERVKSLIDKRSYLLKTRRLARCEHLCIHPILIRPSFGRGFLVIMNQLSVISYQ
jgi:hypothetical protein